MPGTALPPSLLEGLSRMPHERPVSLLLRHAARPPIPPGELGTTLALTPEGITLSRQLGGCLGPHLASLHTSPVSRCVQTAQALLEGSQAKVPILQDRMLGAPGAFVVDERLSGQTFEQLGLDGFLEHLVQGERLLPGLAPPAVAAWALVQHLLTRSGTAPGFHVFVTHDAVLAPTLARVLRYPQIQAHWPDFLEAAFFWREGRSVRGAYRAHEVLLDGG
jgi:broad specificity phosphatase PhoE